MFGNKSRRFSLTLVLVFAFLLLMPLFQASGNGTSKSSSFTNPLTATSFSEITENIIKWIVNIGILIAVVMIIYSGLLFMTAAGEEEKITKAKKALMWSLIGLAILLIGKGWISIIKSLF